MSTETTAARTQGEIVARINEVQGDDFFGFCTEVLLAALDFEHAKPFLNDDVTAEQWVDYREVDTAKDAASYYAFALNKIENHRGLSAERSTRKLREYAWLLGRDDVVEAMDAAGYPSYGAPKVKAFADGMGYAWPDGDLFARMAAGLPSVNGCDEGCLS